MKIYDTLEEAQANPVEGKILHVASFLGRTWYGWSAKNSNGDMGRQLFQNMGGRISRLSNGSLLTIEQSIRSMPKVLAINMLDKLRAEIIGNGQDKA